MPVKLANVIQTLNITKHGHHIKVSLDNVKGSISINQSHEEFEDEKKEKKQKSLCLNLQNVPCSKECPFEIYLDSKLIYKVEYLLREPMTLNFPLKEKKEKIILKCLFEEKEEAKEFNLEENGHFIGIAYSKKKLEFFQQMDDDFQ
jgi:glutaredoxin-related protein